MITPNLLNSFKLAVALAVAAPTVASATIIARDDFESYPAGSILQGNSGGTGWAGAWMAPAANCFGVVADTTTSPLSLALAGGAPVNGGRRAAEGWDGGSSGIDAVRQLATPLTSAFFVSYLVQYGNTNTPPQTNFGNYNTFALHLAGTSGDTSKSLDFGIRSPGSGTRSTFMARVGTGNPGTGASTNLPVNPGVTHLLVAQVVWNGSAFDTMNLWVDPAGGNPGSPPTCTLSNQTGVFSGGVNYLIFRSALSQSDDRYRFDNVLVGTTWNDVVPSSALHVALTNPVAGTAFTSPANILLQATASDTNGSVTNVTFYADATKLAEVATAPYSFNWTGVAARSYALTAVAADDKGLVSASPVVNITVTNSLSVALTHPVTGAAFTTPAAILLEAAASDRNGSVTSVAFYAGATKLAEVAAAPYTFNWTGVTAGSYALTAVAADNHGAFSTSSVVNITVTNSLSATLTNPDGRTVFTAPATILLQAAATDKNGAVTNVAFFAGATRLATVSAAPYSFDWTGVAAGGYALTAVAADDQGISSTSPVVNVVVVNPSSTGQTVTVQKWHPADLSFASTTLYTNPFQDVSLSATLVGPGGLTLRVPGFYAGVQNWKVRFSPTTEGAWSYATSSTDPNLNNQTGTILCVSNTNRALHGALKVDSSHPHYFIYEDGTPCFLMSFEADWLGLMDFGDTNVTKAKSLADIYRSCGFNGVLMNVYAYDTSWEPGTTSIYDFGPPTSYPWLGSNAQPDQSQINPAFFDSYDRVIDYLFQNGMTAHLFFKVYNKQVNWPTNRSAEDNLYFSYVTARYQAYPNIVWDFSKEAVHEQDAVYENSSILNIKALDAYHRLVTIHDDKTYYLAFPDTCDFQTLQGGLYSKLISARNARNWPVFQAETDYYQAGNDGGHTYGVHNDKATVLATTIECLMAGCPVNYYYTYHSWDVVRYNEAPDGLSAYKNLADFFRRTTWRSLAPNDSLIDSAGVGRHCLAIPGSEYVVYLSGAGNVTLTINGAASGNSLTATWLNVVTGAQQALAKVGNGANSFTNPWSDPALLHVTPAQPALTPPATGGVLQLQWDAPWVCAGSRHAG